MGKKKARGKRDESKDGRGPPLEDGLPLEASGQAQSSPAGATTKGSRKKKRKEFSDDYDDELDAVASETGVIAGSSDVQEIPTKEGSAVAVPDQEMTPASGRKISEALKKEGTIVSSVLPGVDDTNTSSETTNIKTDSKTDSKKESCVSDPLREESGMEKLAAVTVEEGNNNEVHPDDEKKKKKKKKKKGPEEEKKSKGPGKAAISKIRKMQAILEEEKKRREEEALMAQRAEEERERSRLEKLRLENERRERQKQKEKERKLKRKLEGKPVTKKERENEARRQAHLVALQEQGMVVPERNEGEKKKVVYGNKPKNKKERVIPFVDESSGEEPGVVESSLSQKEDVNAVCLDSWEDFESISYDDDEVDKLEKDVTEDRKGKEGQGSMEEVESEYSSSSSSGSEDEDGDNLSSYEKTKLRIENRRARCEEERSPEILRSPVVCVLGHVDTGKTKILDKIRRTNVQDGEAGGITQQIGATFVPVEAVREQTKMLKEFSKGEINLPGLLIIDTPGHESFRNLRSRGSSMCDMAILVVDIMHGLEPQTLESLSLLQQGKTPFVVALNKVDRLFDWHRNPSAGIRDTLKRQKPNTKVEFEERVKQVSTEFAEKGVNVALFWDKVDFGEYVPLVPTSAITGDGMGDLIALLVDYSSKNLVDTLMLSMEIEAMVMEVKVIAGLGTTIDVILRNGVLKEGDLLVLMSAEGPFVVTARALLMPQPLKELRVKNTYISHSAIMAAQGIKVTAKGDLDKALPGTHIRVAKRPDEVDFLKEEAANTMKSALNSIRMQERGVYVQSSTLGSLEALLDFLTQSKIPYCGVNIGPVHKKDVMKASVMLEHDPQWAVILAFDIRVEREAQEMADNLSVKIFSADIIYHLFDSFLEHRKELRERNRQQYQSVAVFPCKLRVLPDCVFNSRDPIIVGVVVEAGIVKPGTPLTVPSKEFTDIGVVTSLEVNHKTVQMCRQGEVCLKIEHVGGDAPRLYGRHFDHNDLLVSKVSRESMDAVKNHFREDLQKADWQLMIELKKLFQIM